MDGMGSSLFSGDDCSYHGFLAGESVLVVRFKHVSRAQRSTISAFTRVFDAQW
jgi:hypothetical protein